MGLLGESERQKQWPGSKVFFYECNLCSGQMWHSTPKVFLNQHCWVLTHLLYISENWNFSTSQVEILESAEDSSTEDVWAFFTGFWLHFLQKTSSLRLCGVGTGDHLQLRREYFWCGENSNHDSFLVSKDCNKMAVYSLHGAIWYSETLCSLASKRLMFLHHSISSNYWIINPND